MKYLNYLNLGLALIGVLFCLYALQTTFLGERPDYPLQPEMAQLTEFPPAKQPAESRNKPTQRSQPAKRSLPDLQTSTPTSSQPTPSSPTPTGGTPARLPSGGVVPGTVPALTSTSSESASPTTGRDGRTGGIPPSARPGGGRRGSPLAGSASGRPSVVPPQDRSGGKRDPRDSPQPPRPRGSKQ